MRLRDLDPTLRDRCLALRVRPEQLDFVPSVATSLELAARYPRARPMAILVGSDVVGFAMHGIEESSGQWKIFRLIVDADAQGRGVGSAAVRELVRILVREEGARSILVSYEEENDRARRLYRSVGFREQTTVGSKVTARLDLPPD